MLEKIELINPLKELEEDYRKSVADYINLKLITLEEWNTKFKFYRDEDGYSIIHYLQCVLSNINQFITENPIMIKNREELIKRFKVKIMTLEEYAKLKEKKA